VTTYLQRSDWASAGPRQPLQQLDPANLRGFAVHWPGTTKTLGGTSASGIAARLEGYRCMHTAPGGLGTARGASDIAYQVAIDLEGRVWPLRGVLWKSGANGSSLANSLWGAVLLMLGPGEQPSRRMVQAVQDFRQDVWLRRFPRAVRVVGHRDVRPDGTACPGNAVYNLVKAGTFRRLPGDTAPKPPAKPPAPPAPPPKEPPVPDLTTDQVRNAVLGAAYREYIDEDKDGVREPRTVADLVFATHKNSVETEERVQALQDQVLARDDAQDAALKEIRDAVTQIRDALAAKPPEPAPSS
jgi:hypothetical protein